MAYTVWPDTASEDWCGDFLAREKVIAEDMLETPVTSLVVPKRVSQALKNENIVTLRELTKMEPYLFLRIPNFGKKSLQALEEALWNQYRIGLKSDRVGIDV